MAPLERLNRYLAFWHFAAILLHEAWRYGQNQIHQHILVWDKMVTDSISEDILVFRIEEAIKRRESATVIQAKWRGTFARTSYLLYLMVVIFVQSHIRRFLAQKKIVLMRAERIRKAAGHIQKNWRRLVSWRLYRRLFSARKIQACRRRQVAYTAYSQYLASRKIQSSWRRVVVFWPYRQYKGAQKIQARWRGCCAYKSHKKYRGAKKIQTHWRRYVVFHAYNQYKAAQKFQAAWRRYKKFCEYKQYKAARNFQAAWRRFVKYQAYQRFKGASKFQAAWRRYDKYLAFKQYRGSCKFQAAWRRFYNFRAYKQFKAAQRVQTTWRCYLKAIEYKKYKATQKFQAAWRRYDQFRMYQRYKGAKYFQAAWRRYRAFKAFVQYIKARKIQSFWRMYDVFSVYQEFKAARQIQATWRCHVAFSEYRRYKAAMKIQSNWRRHVAQCYYDLSLRRITLFQAIWRKNRLLAAAINAQRIWRGYFHSILLLKTLSVIIIQAMVRSGVAHLRLKRYKAARKIQALVRGSQQQTRFKQEIATIIIQSLWRSFQVRLSLLRQRQRHAAAITIQTIWRGYFEVQKTWEIVSAMIIQASIRRKLAITYCAKIRAARKIQTLSVFHRLRMRKKKNCAATRIQTRWRTYDARMNFSTYQTDKALVQTMAEAWLSRGIAARMVQQTVFDFLEARRERERDSAAVIQSAWRNYRARRWRDLIRHRAVHIMQRSWRCSMLRDEDRPTFKGWSRKGDLTRGNRHRLPGSLRSKLVALSDQVEVEESHSGVRRSRML